MLTVSLSTRILCVPGYVPRHVYLDYSWYITAPVRALMNCIYRGVQC